MRSVWKTLQRNLWKNKQERLKFFETDFCVILWRNRQNWPFIKRQTSGTSSDNEWQRMTTSGTTSDNEWQRVVQRVTTNDNEWQRVVQRITTSDNERQRVTENDSEWQRVIQQVMSNGNERQRVIAVVQRLKPSQYTSKNGWLPSFQWQKQIHYYFKGWMAATRVVK